MRPIQSCRFLTTLFILVMLPITVYAEPAASLSHLPFLWLVATGLSAALAWFIVKAIRSSGRLQASFRKWAVLVVLTVVLMIFLSPIIVGLGSILITGRTM